MALSVKNEVLYRVYFVALLVLFVALAIFLQMYNLAFVEAPRLEAKADSLYLKWVDARAERGNILATDGSLLATSLPFFDIHFDIKAEGLNDEIFNRSAVDSLAWLLSTYVDQSKTPGAYAFWLDSLRQLPESTRGIRYIEIARDISYARMRQVKQFPIFREGRFKGGLIVEQRSRRERPFKLLAQRTIGYTREDVLPVGLEGSFDAILGGTLGKQLMLRVPGDMYIPVNDLAEIEPEPGADLITTLDINIQDAAETALLNTCQRHNADHGCAIVMEVKTGAIRAIANIGRSNAEGGYWETYNYAVGERVEPGSMFKLASFMAMLEDGYIDDFEEKIPVYGGKVKIFNEEMQDSEAHGRDTMSVREVFAKSSNVGTATLIQKYYGKGKAANYVEHLRDFGINLPTNIEVGGEELPILKDPNDPKSDWSGTTLPWMSIGYELLLTPLQLLTFYNAVANDGRMMKPYLVERTERYGELIKEFPPHAVEGKKSIASSKTIRKAQELLKAVVEEGTATNIKSPHYTIAGKTGTAQVNYHKFKSPNEFGHQASFCGFFPADNPVYSCIVVISAPRQGSYYGADVAAPVFKTIADKCFAMKPALHQPINAGDAPKPTTAMLPSYDAGMKKDIAESLEWLGLNYTKEKKEMPEWVIMRAQNDSLQMLVRNINDKNVPSVVGMGLKDAIYLLENRGCRVRVQGVGKVRRQSLAPGTRANGQTCILYLE